MYFKKHISIFISSALLSFFIFNLPVFSPALIIEENNQCFSMPVNGTITSSFGDTDGRTSPHYGIDIAVPEGTAVKAAHDGTVETAENSKSYGLFVIIKNGNIETLYAHNSSLCVKKGERIKKGETIAYSGNTGYSTGPHVHFEITENNQKINPLNVCR